MNKETIKKLSEIEIKLLAIHLALYNIYSDKDIVNKTLRWRKIAQEGLLEAVGMINNLKKEKKE